MTKLREDKVGISPGLRANTCIIENDYAREITVVESMFGALHKMINKLPWNNLGTDTNMKFVLESL